MNSYIIDDTACHYSRLYIPFINMCSAICARIVDDHEHELVAPIETYLSMKSHKSMCIRSILHSYVHFHCILSPYTETKICTRPLIAQSEVCDHSSAGELFVNQVVAGQRGPLSAVFTYKTRK